MKNPQLPTLIISGLLPVTSQAVPSATVLVTSDHGAHRGHMAMCRRI
ncbi:hypothetical protein [Luteolibacter soli]|uniref:Uncharacterized protein n=1 Tax=Luteolibacter soli TaxID=3135280 RepID=A0ABU9APK8_9BACT